VVGGALGTVIRHNRLQDFNAAIKVNGENGRFPDNGRLLHNHIANQAPRLTDRPVTPVDIVAASGWVVSDNVVAHFAKDGGNRISYGIFMKGGGRQGRIERNLVVCTPANPSQPGVRVGISLGGGGSGAAVCREQPCLVEHHGGVVANNVVAHCNDAGIDVNRSTGSEIRHNTLINTAGIQLRDDPSSARVRANLFDGRLRVRSPAVAEAADNLDGDTRRWWADADRLDLAWKQRPEPVTTADESTDFCGRARGPLSLPGALDGAPC
jgi:parallel beta-helix repeat protein